MSRIKTLHAKSLNVNDLEESNCEGSKDTFRIRIRSQHRHQTRGENVTATANLLGFKLQRRLYSNQGVDEVGK